MLVPASYLNSFLITRRSGNGNFSGTITMINEAVKEDNNYRKLYGLARMISVTFMINSMSWLSS